MYWEFTGMTRQFSAMVEQSRRDQLMGRKSARSSLTFLFSAAGETLNNTYCIFAKKIRCQNFLRHPRSRRWFPSVSARTTPRIRLQNFVALILCTQRTSLLPKLPNGLVGLLQCHGSIGFIWGYRGQGHAVWWDKKITRKYGFHCLSTFSSLFIALFLVIDIQFQVRLESYYQASFHLSVSLEIWLQYSVKRVDLSLVCKARDVFEMFFKSVEES